MSKKVPLCTAIFNKFIQQLENQFTFSNYVWDVLTSNTYSVISIISISKNYKTNFDIIEGSLYACNPIYGIIIPLHFIDSNYQGQNIGSTLLDVLQKFICTIIHSTCIFVWFTNNNLSELLSFYHKLRFHPAHFSCYSFEHTFLSTIINTINYINSLEYFLDSKQNQVCRKDRIQTKNRISMWNLSPLNMICKHKMPKTKIVTSFVRKGKNNTQPNIAMRNLFMQDMQCTIWC